MKTLTRFFLIFVLIGFLSCNKEDIKVNEATYLEFLSDKFISSIKIYNDAIWVLSSKHCDTCYMPPYYSYYPMIAQLTMIKDSTYEYDEPSNYYAPNIDSKGNLFIASNNVLCRLNYINDYSIVLETGEFSFNSFVFDKDDNIWFGGYNGIAFWNKTELKIYNTDNSDIPSNITHGLVIDNSGTIWVALDFSGLLKIESNNWEIIPNSEIIGLKEDSYLTNPIVDNENNIWFNVFNPDTNSNILIYNGEKWNYQYVNQDNFYGDLVKDSKGTFWAISDSIDQNTFINSSLAYYQDDEWIDYNINDVASKIITVNADSSKVYIGTVNGLIEKNK